MTMAKDDMIFIFCSNVVFIPWLALMIAPKWKWTTPTTKVVVLAQCVVYSYYFGSYALKNKADLLEVYGGMSTLSGLARLFGDSDILLPAWVHYLAFDLVVAHTVVQRNIADANGLSKVAMAPCLFLTCMAGPAGVLLYVVLRACSSVFCGKPAAGSKSS